MINRFQELFRIEPNLYVENSPVIIEVGVLHKDNATDKVLAQIKLRNIDEKNIISCKVSIKAFEVNGTEIEGVKSHSYLDINVAFGGEFGSKIPVYLPNIYARKIEISILEVVFFDGTIWKNNNSIWKQIPVQKAIVEEIKDPELLKQFEIEVGKDAVFVPKIAVGLFQCTCGTSNSSKVSNCYNCGRSYDELKKIDLSYLQFKTDERLKEEQRIIEEQRFVKEESEEKAKIKNEKNKKIRIKRLKIIGAISLLILVIISFFAISEPDYIKYVKYVFLEKNIQTKYEELYNIDVFNSKSKSSQYFKEYIIDSYNNSEYQNVVDTLTSKYKYYNDAKSMYTIADDEINNAFEESLYELAKSNKNDISKLDSISLKLNHLNSKFEIEVIGFIDSYYISKITDGSWEVQNYFYEKYKQNSNSTYYGYLLKAIHYEISKDGVEYRLSASFQNGYSQQWGFANITSFYKELKNKYPSLAEDQCYDTIRLFGYWSSGGTYLQMKSDGSLSYNLPWFNYGDYYKLYNQTIMLYPENDESSTRNLFKITFLSDNSIRVYCYHDSSTYVLYK